MPTQDLRPGDIFRISDVDHSDYGKFGLVEAVGDNGIECSLPEDHEGYWTFPTIELAIRGSRTEVPESSEEWQEGDILMRLHNGSGLTEGSFVKLEQTVRRDVARVTPLNGERGIGDFLANYFQWVTRPVVEAAQAPLPFEEWLPGDIIRRTGGRKWTNEVEVGHEVIFLNALPYSGDSQVVHLQRLNGRTGTHHIEDYTWVSRPGSVVAKPAQSSTGVAPFQLTKRKVTFPFKVDLVGVPDALIDSLVNILKEQGYPSHNAYDNRKTAVGKHKDTLLVRNGSDAKDYLYYYDYHGMDVKIPQDWNGIMDALEEKKMVKKTKDAEKVAPPRAFHLQALPYRFIIEDKREQRPSAEQQQQNMQGMGFRGTTGSYTLFSGHKMSATEHSGVAAAFQELTGCVRFVLPEDTLQLNLLLRHHKTMLLSSPAQKQRFAIDVAASGPHLILAFKTFMQSIGYRQLSPEVETGAYILVNGGNLPATEDTPTTAATWQYSTVKNNRSATLSLDTDWDKLTERLANQGVALPVLDLDNTGREAILGDQVIFLNNSVDDTLPETEPTLRAVTLGKVYTVEQVSGDLLLINTRYYHKSRVQVVGVTTSRQNGDLVTLNAAYGDVLRTGQVYTYWEGKLLDDKGDTYMAPEGYLQNVDGEALKELLLQRLKITLPLTVNITRENTQHAGQDVVLVDAWPLNNQQLGFWTEGDTDHSAWYELGDFTILRAHTTPQQQKIEVRKAPNPAESELLFTQAGAIPLAEVEKALALAYC